MRRLARQGARRLGGDGRESGGEVALLWCRIFGEGGGGGAFAAAFSLCWAFFASFACFLAKAFCAFLDMGLSPPSAAGLPPAAAAAAFFSAAAFFFAAFLSTMAIGCAGSSCSLMDLASLILAALSPTLPLTSSASPPALAALTASPAASHCLTRASMMLLRRVGGVKQDVLLQPSFWLWRCSASLSQTRARAARGTITFAARQSAASVLRLAASLIAVKNLWLAVCKTLASRYVFTQRTLRCRDSWSPNGRH